MRNTGTLLEKVINDVNIPICTDLYHMKLFICIRMNYADRVPGGKISIWILMHETSKIVLHYQC